MGYGIVLCFWIMLIMIVLVFGKGGESGGSGGGWFVSWCIVKVNIDIRGVCWGM